MVAAKLLRKWWPETGLNRRRRPFQGRALPLSYLALGVPSRLRAGRAARVDEACAAGQLS